MRYIIVNAIIEIDHCCTYNETDSTCTNCDTNYEVFNSKCYLKIDHCCAYNESDSTCINCVTDYEEI